MGLFSSLFGNKNYTKINNAELENIIKNNKNALILDVRTPGEFKGGHIPKAKNIPVQQIGSQLNTLATQKENDIIVYCASGARSANAANILSKNGFNKVYNLGGIGNYKGQLK